jgi:hypothetical protein
MTKIPEMVTGVLSAGANRVFCRILGFGGAAKPVSVVIVAGAAVDTTSPTS